jgi:MFS family permease
MGELFSGLTTFTGWIGVVIVGILASLVAAYLKPRLDRVLSSISYRWATRTEERRRQRTLRIELLKNNHLAQIQVRMDEMAFRIMSVLLLIMGLAFFVTAVSMVELFDLRLLAVFAMGMAMISTLFALNANVEASRIR